jgi:hypothetical protein
LEGGHDRNKLNGLEGGHDRNKLNGLEGGHNRNGLDGLEGGHFNYIMQALLFLFLSTLSVSEQMAAMEPSMMSGGIRMRWYLGECRD